MIMMCQCRFISYNKCTTLVGDVDGGGEDRGTGVRGNSVLSSQFCFKRKTALKIKSIFLKKF